MVNKLSSKLFLFALAIFAFARICEAQTTIFTYQGRLTDSAAQANGTYDLRFALFDDAGTQIGATEQQDDVSVVNGVFTVQLDFGAAAFAGANRVLEISIRRGAETGAFIALTPRQPLTSTPYAIRSSQAATADTATNALNVGGTPAAQIIRESDARLTNSRDPNAGSGNYVQNTTTQQTSTNFSIDGTGAANVFNAAAQFNIGGSRFLSRDARENTFVGRNTGTANTTGTLNVFVGENAGQVNGSGSSNSFVGYNAGLNNNGSNNSFFGTGAGELNTNSNNNSFFGRSAGQSNSTGGQNSFVGRSAGRANTTGGFNSFLGNEAGLRNTTGAYNSFLGNTAGQNNTTGNGNVFIGSDAGAANTIGSGNVALGDNADFGANNLTNATAIGAGAVVNNSNSVVLGTAADTVRIPGNLVVTGTLTALIDGASITNLNAANITTGTLDSARVPNLDASKITSGTFNAARIPDLGATYVRNQTTQQIADFNVSGTGKANVFDASAQYNIGGNRVLSVGSGNLFAGIGTGVNNVISNTLGTGNSFVGHNAGNSNYMGYNNSFFGMFAGLNNYAGKENSFFGVSAGNSNTSGSDNSLFGTGSGMLNSTGSGNSFFGYNAGLSNTTGGSNTFSGSRAGIFSTTGVANTFIGTLTGWTNRGGSQNTALGYDADVGSDNLTYATAIGAGAVVNSSNTIALGRANGTDRVMMPGGVSFSTVNNGNNDRIRYSSGINGLIFSAGDSFQWFNIRNDRVNMELASNGNLSIVGNYEQISDARYKTNAQTFTDALDTVRRLRGVTFNWKPELNKSPKTQIGFIAQEVEAVLPHLVSTDKDGYKTVSYSNAVPVLVEAVKEQQTQIERQQKQIEELKRIVCAIQPGAAVCKAEEK